MPTKRVCLAKISQTHGVKGLVKLFLYGEDIGLLEETTVFTSKDGSETLKIQLKNPSGKYYLAAIDGVNDKTAAETHKGKELWVDRTALPETDDDEFYYADLIGLDVQDDKGDVIGTIKAVDNFGASDLLDIRLSDGGSLYLPFTDDYVPDVNITEGFVRAVNIDEFIEDKQS